MAWRLFVSAGEVSGDRHAAEVVRRLRDRLGSLEVRGLGGEHLRREGADLMAETGELSVLGFAEVARRLPFFFRLMGRVTREIEAWRPHAVLPVDYPGFNLRLGRRARARGLPVIYYIAPQVWAWKRDRRPGIARALDRLLVVFPFEETLFREAGIDARFVGHPLLDATPGDEPVRPTLGIQDADPLLAVLPGSRRQEVEKILPPVLQGVARLGGEAAVAVSRAPGLPDRLFAEARAAGYPVWEGSARALAASADAALVASGTATLETGLAGTPLAVLYRSGWLNWTLAKRVVGIRTVGLVNIAAGGDRVPELLQDRLTPDRVAETARKLLFDRQTRREQAAYLSGLASRLGGVGAAERAADEVAGFLRERGEGRR
jgi:lipid-A-disaccharide synthase